MMATPALLTATAFLGLLAAKLLLLEAWLCFTWYCTQCYLKHEAGASPPPLVEVNQAILAWSPHTLNADPDPWLWLKTDPGSQYIP